MAVDGKEGHRLRGRRSVTILLDLSQVGLQVKQGGPGATGHSSREHRRGLGEGDTGTLSLGPEFCEWASKEAEDVRGALSPGHWSVLSESFEQEKGRV